MPTKSDKTILKFLKVEFFHWTKKQSICYVKNTRKVKNQKQISYCKVQNQQLSQSYSKAAQFTKGGSGPSCLDGDGWRHILRRIIGKVVMSALKCWENVHRKWREPQAAYPCFTAGYQHKLTYFMRTIAGCEEQL